MTSKRIFIILAEYQTRNNLRSFYEGEGHYVVTSGTASEALKILQQITSPDLIIISGSFPFLSVSEFIQILSNDKRLNTIPVVSNLDLTQPHTWLDALAVKSL